MQKHLLSLIALFFTFQVQSQILYLETFDGISGPTAGGAGTYTFPPDMLLRNVDNLTPAGAVAYVNEAWERREDFNFNVADSCAFSTSWYSPAGQADDWMWTPGVALPGAGTIQLSWNAVTYDALYPDGYEVRVMTVPPTGGTGALGNQIASSTQVFSIGAENTAWTSRTVNLNAFAGQTVYIGFRNNSTDMFLLLIDDIKVEVIMNFDASVTAAQGFEYTLTPVAQAAIPLGGTVSNLGASALTNVNLHANIYNSSNVLVYTGSSVATPSIAPAGNSVFSMSPYVPTLADVYTIKYYHTETETDVNTPNDTLTTTIEISENVFARDNGVVTGALGIGAGNGGYLGQSFTLTTPAYLYSVFTYYNQGYTGEKHACLIWNTDGLGVPTTILASTDTMLYPNNSPLSVTSPIYGGTILLPAGTYVATAVEFDSTVQLGTTNDIFTAGKMWVNWPTIPGGNWTNVETFGAGFAKPYTLRLNLGSTLFALASEELSLKGKAGANRNELSWSNNEDEGSQYTYTLEQSTDSRTWTGIHTLTTLGKKNISTYSFADENNTHAKNYYRIKVLDQDNHIKYSNTVNLINTGTEQLTEVYPNPAKDVITVNTNRFRNSVLTILDLQGKVILTSRLEAAVTTLSLQGIARGVYQITVSNPNETLYNEKLILE